MANASSWKRYGNVTDTIKYDGPTYGNYTARHGFCPRIPFAGICDANECEKDNHCRNLTQKCCYGQCGFLRCLDAVDGVKKIGDCPHYLKVPVEMYPEEPINECDTDAGCKNNEHKCCPTIWLGTFKCVLPTDLGVPVSPPVGASIGAEISSPDPHHPPPPPPPPPPPRRRDTHR